MLQFLKKIKLCTKLYLSTYIEIYLQYFLSIIWWWWWWWWWLWIIFVVWLTEERHLALFPARIIVIDRHHWESPTRREQDLILCNTWVQTLLNDVVNVKKQMPWLVYMTCLAYILLFYSLVATFFDVAS